MAIEVFNDLALAYQQFLETLPLWTQNFLNLFLMVLTVVIYSMIIWFVYRFMARRDIFPLDYEKFKRPNWPFLNKLIAGFLYFIKNIIVSPILIFFYYGIFTFILLSLTEGISLDKILLVAAIIVASIRATAYYRENLSRDLAKLLPLTLLGVALVEGSLNVGGVISSFSDIPSLFGKISIYFLFIIALEAILRLTDIFLISSGVEEGDEVKEE
ncbi:MAG: hypothetical protein KC516_02405 [Nanoarchaeota archaeon]|nr:hypothetical protein [Nanoarchaeota archaeon]